MEKYRILSDIFAVPGLLCLFFGGLRWLSGQGAFQGVSYVLKNAFCLLTFREREPYRPAKTKKNGFAVLLGVGGVFLGIAGIFTGLYYR